MTDEELKITFTQKITRDEMKNRISMALKDPILQQGFEIICKENAELKSEKGCETCTKFDEIKLTKATKFLNEFMRISKASDEDFEHDYSELIGETEQFLKEIEK